MASVEVTGPMQVTLKLNTPDSAMPGILSDRAGMMVSPTAIKANGGAVNRTPVGAGAYAFVSWADGERIVVKRNEKYWKKDRPYPDGIEFAIIPELTTGVRSVTAGQNDLIYQLPPRQKVVVERSNNLKVVNGPTLYVFQIFLNWAKPPFDDIRVRKLSTRTIANLRQVAEALPSGRQICRNRMGLRKSVAGLIPTIPAGRSCSRAAQGDHHRLLGYPEDSVQGRNERAIPQGRIGIASSTRRCRKSSAAFFGAENAGRAARRMDRRPDPS